jgi:hypothetical protein
MPIFSLNLFLSEGQVGKAWEPSNKSNAVSNIGGALNRKVLSPRLISGFRRGINEIFACLEIYAA